MRQAMRFVLVGLFVFSFSSSHVWAQATAQISGSVRDQSGAVLPGVEVVAVQTETGITRSTITNETGSYVLPNLAIGPYRVEAALPGFRTYVQMGILLEVNASLVVNPVLEVGEISEQIEVQASTAAVETRTVGVGAVMQHEQIMELPLNGRDVSELIALAGASTPSPTGTNNRDPFVKQTISVAGGSSIGLNYSLDGANHNNPIFGTNLIMPFPDALQEFKLETSATSAEKGVKPAGSVSLVTKSGTNAFHGNAFEFVRNAIFNARDASALTRDTIKRNQFGGTVGGPIRQNKLFFFAGYQGTTLRQAPTSDRQFVPTAAMLAGDFTTVASAACRTIPLTLSAPFVNNRVNPALFSKAALNLTKLLPVPSDPCGEVRTSALIQTNEFMAVGRIDKQKSAKHSLFGRYLVSGSVTPPSYDLRKDPLTITTSTGNGTDALTQSFAFGSTYLLSSSVVNSFRFTADRLAAGRQGASFVNWPSMGIKAYSYVPDLLKAQVNGAFSITTGGAGPTRSALFGLNDDISLIRGNHQLAFGGNAAMWWTTNYSNNSATGIASFSSDVSGLGLGDFLLGQVNSWTMGTAEGSLKRSKYIGVYGSDTWQVTKKLTLNYGLRWEPFFPVINLDGYTLHFDLDAFRKGIKSTYYKNTPPGLFYEGDPGVPGKAYMYNRWWNVSPRVGLAWDVSGDGRTSVRASGGTFYDFPPTYYQTAFRGAPNSPETVITGVKLDDPWANYPGGDPYPVKEFGRKLSPDAAFPPGALIISPAYDTPNTRVGQWNLSVQRQVGKFLVTANYIGSATRHIWSNQHLNPGIFIPGVGDASGRCFLNGQAVPYTVRSGTACTTTGNIAQRRQFSLENPTYGPLYGFVSTIDSGGTASYNGLLLSIQRRVARGATVNANYTWSHCIISPVAGGGQSANGGLNSSQGGSGNIGYINPSNRSFDKGNCASSLADRRHVFNLSGVAQSPTFSNAVLRAVASEWHFSPILRILSGVWQSATVPDTSFSGIANQRPNQILPNIYGDKTQNNWLNPAAFARPVPGTLGNMGPNTILGPGQFQFDASLARTFVVREAQQVEFRAEAFNVTNSPRLGNPTINTNSSQFGRIQSKNGSRIMQFALKYFF
jgi:carboxypeptidase family protein